MTLVGSWLHCNDAKMKMVTIDEVYKAQAYILIYVRTSADGQPLPQLCMNAAHTSDVDVDFAASRVAKFSEARKRTVDGSKLGLKRRKTTIW